LCKVLAEKGLAEEKLFTRMLTTDDMLNSGLDSGESDETNHNRIPLGAYCCAFKEGRAPSYPEFPF
jgi:hypothetical protein